MSLSAQWAPYELKFTFEAITSRQRMLLKDTYFVRLCSNESPGVYGIGECALFKGLSADDIPEYERELSRLCANPELWPSSTLSSLRFGFETAFADLQAGGRHRWADTPWSEGKCGIPINGLVWMSDIRTMRQRVEEKLNQGFRVIKIKIGALDFESEFELVSQLRKRFMPTDLEIRLDANGAFSPGEALKVLSKLAPLHIHSVEQPIRAGQPEAMADLCTVTPVAIALDEELIGYRREEDSAMLLDYIKPQYIILKPALAGGFSACDSYIRLAEERGIGWWATSALESNIGLNAIAQWLSQKNVSMPQGLGTGMLYGNNIASPLEMHDAALWHKPATPWDSPDFLPWR